jgi:hypothetical protein
MTKIVAIIVTSIVTAGILVWSLSVSLNAPSSNGHGAKAVMEEQSAGH